MITHDLITVILTSAGGHEEPFDWSYVIKHSINLALLIGLLVYLLRKPLMAFLKKRKETITSEIDQAKKAIEEAKIKHEEYATKLKNLESEISSLKDNIKKQGKLEKEELVAQAINSSELIRKEVKDTVELETLRAKEQIQSEVANSSIKLAEKLIREKIQTGTTTDAVDDLVKKIEEGKWQQLQH